MKEQSSMKRRTWAQGRTERTYVSWDVSSDGEGHQVHLFMQQVFTEHLSQAKHRYCGCSGEQERKSQLPEIYILPIYILSISFPCFRGTGWDAVHGEREHLTSGRSSPEPWWAEQGPSHSGGCWAPDVQVEMLAGMSEMQLDVEFYVWVSTEAPRTFTVLTRESVSQKRKLKQPLWRKVQVHKEVFQ